MTPQEQIRTLIYRAIDHVNDVLRPDDAIHKAPGTVLMGDAQAFDSMGFVTFMAALEDHVSKTTGRELSIVDTMFADDVEEWTVDSLAARLADVLHGDGDRAGDGSVVAFPRAAVRSNPA